jgi:hypothetical protein
MDVKQIDAGDLNVGYVDAGPEYGPAVLRATRAESKHDRSEKRGCFLAISKQSTSRRKQWVRPHDEPC